MSYTMWSTCVGHIVMPFSSKFPNLGKTVKTRIPESCYHHIILLLDEYERIAEAKGTIFLEQMQGRLEESLSNIVWLCGAHKMSVWGTHLGHIVVYGAHGKKVRINVPGCCYLSVQSIRNSPKRQDPQWHFPDCTWPLDSISNLLYIIRVKDTDKTYI